MQNHNIAAEADEPDMSAPSAAIDRPATTATHTDGAGADAGHALQDGAEREAQLLPVNSAVVKLCERRQRQN